MAQSPFSALWSIAARVSRVNLRVAVVALLVAAGLVSVTLAQRAAQNASLPNFDVRTEKDAASSTFLMRFAPTASLVDVSAGRADGLARLQAAVPGAEVEVNPELGTPEIVGVPSGAAFLTEPSTDRVGAMRGFLSNYADMYGLSQEQIASLELVADYTNPSGNMSWVEFEQRVNGLPVFRGLIRGGFTAKGQLARTTGPLASALDGARLPSTPQLSAEQAVSRAAASVGMSVSEGALIQKANDGGRRITFARGSFSADTRAWLLYFPLSPGVARLAWATEVWGNPDAFLILTDAEDGTVLFRKNMTNYQTQSAIYAAYLNDSPAPMSPSTTTPGMGLQAPVIFITGVSLIGNEGLRSFNNLGWMTDGTSLTDGNNVEAGLDRDGTDGVDAPVTGTGFRVFTYAFNPGPGSPPPGDAPLTPAYQAGEVTDGFYWTNEYHDRLYLLGFTEAARNFQNDNFGRGGIAGDRVRGEFQDSSGVNNANFTTPSDGGRGRMQMYIFDSPTPDRTSGLDHDVLIHELTHGTSNRLHNNGAGLGTTMSGGMGEGWSDFYARALLSSSDEDPNGIYSTGGWVTYLLGGQVDNYYYGIRRFPYASFSTVGANGKPHNPLTFADMDPTQINTTDGAFPNSPIIANTAFQVHNIGQIWASALLEVRARFITRLGWFAGNQRILQFVTDGMKLDPVNPTFLQGRDSILAAANAGGGTVADINDIWAGFATRGMGVSAQVLNAATGSVIEAFDVPGIAANGGALVAESVPNGRLDAGEVVTVSLCITNSGGLTSGSVTGALQATGGVQAPSGPQVYGTVAPAGNVCHTFSFTVGAACGSTLTATLQAQEMGGLTRNLNYNFTVGSQSSVFSQNFDGVGAPALPAGWTSSTLAGTPNLWVTNVTTPDTAPNRAFAGDPATISDNVLVSPTIAMPAGGSVLSFRNSYSTETGFDGGVLEIAINGGAFTDIIAAGGSFVTAGYNSTISTGFSSPIGGRQAWSGNSAGYVTSSVNIPPAANGQNAVLRWRMATDSSVAATGWAVDTVNLFVYTCSNVAPVITTHPQSQTVMSGTTATLSVVASGTGPLSYQWYSGISPNTASPVGGATSSSYTTPALVAPTSYWVRVSNLVGPANSNTANLTIGPANGAEMVANGDFSGGTTNWNVFEPPDIVWSVVGGVFQWFRANPTTTPSGQAVVFQETGLPVGAGKALAARFDIANSSTARKRISVLIIDSNFSDITVCTFWLAPGAPMRTYNMLTHTTKNWANAAIYFYAATKGADGGNYHLDNVSLSYSAAGSTTTTTCMDPTVPAPPGGGAGPNLLVNGDFATGTLAPWGEFGAITHQIAGGVFEFYRNAPLPTPAGVILQATGQAMSASQILTTRFLLGNSSSVRKRVTVIVHDNDFSDLMACTFWLPPGQPLLGYQITGFVTEAWTNATVSVYGATVGSETWMRLDNVSLQRTPATVILGTECMEPIFAPLADIEASAGDKGDSPGAPAPGPAPAVRAPATGRASTAPFGVFAAEDGPRTIWQDTFDLRDANAFGLSLESYLVADESTATIEISFDGRNWSAVGVPPPADEWLMINVDLSPYVGQVVHVRMLFDAVTPRPGRAADLWGVRNVRVTNRR